MAATKQSTAAPKREATQTDTPRSLSMPLAGRRSQRKHGSSQTTPYPVVPMPHPNHRIKTPDEGPSSLVEIKMGLLADAFTLDQEIGGSTPPAPAPHFVRST